MPVPEQRYEDENNLVSYDKQPSARTERIKSKIKFTRLLLLLIAAVFALVILFVNRDKLNADNFRRLAAKIDIGLSSAESSDNSVIDYDYNSSGAVGVYKDGIARVTTDSLVIMDNAGTQFQSVLTGFNNPALVTTNKYVMTYDRGGRRLIITNSFTVVFDKVFDDNIVTAAMNDNGYFAVVTESDAYKNILTVYNSSFSEIYKLNSMSRYIIAADISNDNKHAAVSSYYVKDGNVIPQINYYSFTGEESLWNYDFDEKVAVSVVCKDDGSVAGLFEWGICVLDSKGREKHRFEFNNKILQAYYLSRDKYNMAVLSDSHSGNSEAVVFENTGKSVSNIDTQITAVSADIASDRIALLSRDRIFIYSVSGKLISERENVNDGTKILFSDKNSVLVVSDSGIVYNLID